LTLYAHRLLACVELYGELKLLRRARGEDEDGETVLSSAGDVESEIFTNLHRQGL
jgi:hypothetical protein